MAVRLRHLRHPAIAERDDTLELIAAALADRDRSWTRIAVEAEPTAERYLTFDPRSGRVAWLQLAVDTARAAPPPVVTLTSHHPTILNRVDFHSWVQFARDHLIKAYGGEVVVEAHPYSGRLAGIDDIITGADEAQVQVLRDAIEALRAWWVVHPAPVIEIQGGQPRPRLGALIDDFLADSSPRRPPRR